MAKFTQKLTDRKQLAALLFMLLFLFSAGIARSGDISSNESQAAYINVSISPEELGIRDVLSIESNTLFSFYIPRNEYVRFALYDTMGKELSVLINEYKPASNFSVELKKANLKKGVYFYRLDVGRYRELRKLNITK